MKFIKRLIWFSVFMTILGFGASLVISKYYEGSLKTLAVQQINKQLAAEIGVDDVQLTVFKKFPYTSLEFQNVWAKDALIKVGEQDTFFYFHHAYLQFNLVDILKNRFILREITLEDGFINPRVDKEGYDNYHIFKKTESKTNDFLINLEQVTLNNVEVDYEEAARKDQIQFDAHHAYLKGLFSKDEFELDIYGEFDMRVCELKSTQWVTNRDLNVDFGLYINSSTKHYDIRRGGLEVDNSLDFEIEGTIDNASHTLIDLNVKGKNLDIVRSLALLPKRYSKSLEAYKSEGEITFSSNIIGQVSNNRTPKITADFAIKNGTIVEKTKKIELRNLNLDGLYTGNNNLELTNVSFQFDGGLVQGDYKMKGTKHPLVEVNLVGVFDLEITKNFLGLDTLSVIQGNMKIDANYKGMVDDISNLKLSDLERAKTSGAVNLKNVNFKVKGSDKYYKNINADLALHGNDVLINELSGSVINSDFSLTGIFSNMMAFLLIDGQKLTVEAEFNSSKLDFNELLSSNVDESDTAYSVVLPENINLNLKANVGEVLFRRFSATDISGIMKFSNSKLKISPLQFNSMDGEYQANCIFYPVNGGNYRAVIGANITQIDIKKLFYDFENFGQEELTSKHLKGNANATVNFKTDFTSKLKVNPKKIYTNIDITISDGELIRFKPLYSVSDYIKSNKLLNIFIKSADFKKELEHIKFNTLRNQILIKNEVITIPKMEINSSAMNMVVEGTHTFNNEINYKMNFYLSELLTRNGDRENSQGRTQVYLTMTGTTENPIVEYEKNTISETAKDEVRKEKQAVKQAFKDEFGLFNNDTTLIEAEQSDEKLEFAIEWDEDDSQNKIQKKEGENNKTTKQKFLNILKEEKEKKNTDDFDFDDDDF
ncbi:MAG: hypothetical protein HOB26_01930 [Flavobacteriales bacterium]|nr:hypothetical protein [Flavobacteriales bacterium]